MKRELSPDSDLTRRECNIRAAALMDGEGCIAIRPPNYAIECILTTTTPVLAQWMYDNYGGTLHNKKVYGVKHKPEVVWRCGSAIAEDFLREIMPFLLLKGEQANCALELRSHQGRHMKSVSSEEKLAIWKPYHARMIALHDSGRSVK